jgi:hypothetical protein
MANYAVINGNIVENVIVADTKEIAEQVIGKECIEYTNSNPAGIGYTYADGVFTAPVIEEIPAE